MATESTRTHDVPHGPTGSRRVPRSAWKTPAALAGSLTLSVLAACAPKMDPATARAQFSSKSRSMEGAPPVDASSDATTARKSDPNAASPTESLDATSADTNLRAVAHAEPPRVPSNPTSTSAPESQATSATRANARSSSASSSASSSTSPSNQSSAPASAANPATDPSAILRAASRDQWAALRAHAVEASIRNPKLLAELAPAALRDENRGVRFVACMAIAEAGLTSLSDELTALLGDPSPSVQAAAMLALHRAGRKVNFTPLAAMIENNDPEVRANAYLVLGEIGNDSAIPLIRQSIGRGMKLVNPLRVRLVDLAAAEALVKLGDEFEAEPIRAALFAPPEQGELTVVACDSVRRLRDEVARPMLERIVSASGAAMRSPEIRLAACRALVRLGSGSAPLVIAREYAAHPDARVRAQAAALLGEIGTPEALQMLVGMLADASTSVQVAAAGGLEAAD